MLSSLTRNIALGSASTTSPSSSTFSSFGIRRRGYQGGRRPIAPRTRAQPVPLPVRPAPPPAPPCSLRPPPPPPPPPPVVLVGAAGVVVSGVVVPGVVVVSPVVGTVV